MMSLLIHPKLHFGALSAAVENSVVADPAAVDSSTLQRRPIKPPLHLLSNKDPKIEKKLRQLQLCRRRASRGEMLGSRRRGRDDRILLPAWTSGSLQRVTDTFKVIAHAADVSNLDFDDCLGRIPVEYPTRTLQVIQAVERALSDRATQELEAGTVQLSVTEAAREWVVSSISSYVIHGCAAQRMRSGLKVHPLEVSLIVHWDGFTRPTWNRLLR